MPSANRKPISFFVHHDDPSSAELFIDHYESGQIGLSARDPLPQRDDPAYADILPVAHKEDATYLLAKMASAVNLKPMVVVESAMLFAVLRALNGYGHEIRELQVCAQLATTGLNTGEDSFNPIGVLTEQYNDFAKRTESDPLPTEIPK
jgi:hypothetical protein